MAWLEPMLEVETASGRIAYGPIEPGDVDGLLDAGFLEGGDHPKRIGRPEDVPFLAKQTRLTFKRCGITDPLSLDDYRAHGGLEGLKRAIEIGPAATVAEVTDSGLRGRGGAGFPTGIKWKTVLDTDADRKYIVANADEGDSGTFSDRMIMEGDPFCLIEGMAIAGIATRATKGYIYIRSEYPHRHPRADRGDPSGAQGRHPRRIGARLGLRLRHRAPRRRRRLCLRRGDVAARQPRRQARPGAGQAAAAGAQGPVRQADRHQQRHLARLRAGSSSTKGGAFYKDFGMGRSRGTIPIQIAGNVKHGGLFEAAFGMTLGDIVDEIGGGTETGRPVQRRAGRRPARRLFPARAVRHAVRLRGLRREGRADRPRRHRRLRRHRGHAEAGALRLRVLRHRMLRQVHALPHRLDARRRGDRPARRQHRAARSRSSWSPTSATP